MAFKNLRAEIEAEMRGYATCYDREVIASLVPVTWVKRLQEQKERDASIPETKAQATHRKRLARAKRVEGLARGQH